MWSDSREGVHWAAFGCAVLVVLTLVPAGAVASPDDGAVRPSAEADGSERATPAERTDPATGDRTSTVVAAANESDCVVEDTVTGSAYPEHFRIGCSTAGPDNSTLHVTGLSALNGGPWAFVVYVTLPDEIRGRNEIPGGSTVTDNIVAGKAVEEIANMWRTHLSVPDDQIAVVADSGASFAAPHGADGPTYWYTLSSPEVPMNPVLHPGVYEIRTVAYNIWKDGPAPTALPEDLDPYEMRPDVISGAPTESSPMTVEMGGCRADFDAAAELNALDRQKLNSISRYFAARRDFEANKLQGTRDAFLWGSSEILLEGLKLDDAVENLAGLALPSPLDLKDAIDEGNELGDEMARAVQRLNEIEEDRQAIYHDIERCYGDNYRDPEVYGYERLSRADINEAKRADGDIEKDES
jgi:hypothetical protein